MFSILYTGFQMMLTPSVFMLITAGTVLGVIFGAMPGVSASMAVALALPFAYEMAPETAVGFLAAVYSASITGGGITAILYRVPGTPSSAPTILDGYPMAQKEGAGKALGFSLIASSAGGMIGALAMVLICMQLSAVARRLGYAELFAIGILGLCLLPCLDRRNIVKTMISVLLGLLLACMGMDPFLKTPRFAWSGSVFFSEIEMIPVMIGLFVTAEVFKQTEKHKKPGKAGKNKDKKVQTGADKRTKTVFPGAEDLWNTRLTMLRSSFVGLIVGILPGAGATIASFLSYAIEKRMSKNPERLGTGVSEGIVASEAANNAATAGSMVPLLSFGIPGGNAAAIMMTILLVKGVQVGPYLLEVWPEYLSSVFSAMFLTNILMVIVAAVMVRGFEKLFRMPYSVLGPVILVLAAAGAYGLNQSMRDVLLMAGAGIFGYLFIRLGYNSAALVLGLVLGQESEMNLRLAYVLSGQSLAGVFSNPATAVILAGSAGMLAYSFWKEAAAEKTEESSAKK